MSGLTGYLTPSGIDLSYIFHPINNRTFTNLITTDIGIKGPSSSITYSAGMIGYVGTVNAAASNTAITSGTITNLNSFTLTPGVYLCIAYGHNIYSSSGELTNFYLGVSSISGNTSSDGFWVNILQSISLPDNSNGLRFIIGNAFSPLKVATATNFYLIQRIDFSSINTVKNSPTGVAQSYFKYVRVA